MVQWLFTFGNGVLVYVVLPVVVLALLLLAHPATRRDLIEKAGIVRGMLDELVREFGPVLATSTGRNAALLGVTGALGAFMPAALAENGAKVIIVAALVWYFMRTIEGRKRAAGPILTPMDRNAIRDTVAPPVDNRPQQEMADDYPAFDGPDAPRVHRLDPYGGNQQGVILAAGQQISGQAFPSVQEYDRYLRICRAGVDPYVAVRIAAQGEQATLDYLNRRSLRERANKAGAAGQSTSTTRTKPTVVKGARRPPRKPAAKAKPVKSKAKAKKTAKRR